MIHAVASLPHYWRHLEPIVVELRARGEDVAVWGDRRGRPWGPAWAARNSARGAPVLVASWADARLARGHPLVYVEHGAGQTYQGHAGEPGWPGGRGLDDVVLFLCPGDHVARLWRAEYRAAVAVVGCPALDAQLRSPRDGGARAGAEANSGTRHGSGGPAVAFTFHWNCGIAPEARPAWPHYRPQLPITLRALRGTYQVVGHGHPRIWRRLEPAWKAFGVEPVASWDDVLDRADVLVADNTSAMYEWAALDRPVVVLNAPWYRRDVEHGLRFWSHVPGIQCEGPAGLPDAIGAAVEDGPDLSALRRRAADHVYAHRDGTATARAADAVQGAVMALGATRRVVASEKRSRLDDLLYRLGRLGATDDELAMFQGSWEAEPPDEDEQLRLVTLNDQALVAEIVAVRDEHDYHTLTEQEAADRSTWNTAEAEYRAILEAAFERIYGNVADVQAWVDGDPYRAAAIIQWEQGMERPRTGLMRRLSALLPTDGTGAPFDPVLALSGLPARPAGTT